MKQYTTPEQTAKLIELGFEKPSNTIVKEEPTYREGSIIDWKLIAEEGSYSIGELIEMLPPKIEAEMEDESDDEYAWLSLEEGWDVLYRSGYYIVERLKHSKELIDALFEMLVQLREEGVI
jgi:hypothetical protein